MTKEELIARLNELLQEDKEIAHEEADRALIAYINEAEIRAAYDKIAKWHA